jgi:hypothetical protein
VPIDFDQGRQFVRAAPRILIELRRLDRDRRRIGQPS